MKQGAVGLAFVTPHAVRQFQDRIALLTYEQALAAIIHGLEQYSNIRPLSNGVGFRVRVRRPFPFRAIIRPPQDGTGELPVVITILKGDT